VQAVLGLPLLHSTGYEIPVFFFTVPGSQCREKAASDKELFDGGRKTSCESMPSDIVKSPYFPPARLQLVTLQMDTVSAFDILDQK